MSLKPNLIKRVALLTDGLHPLVLGGMQKHSYYLLVELLARDIAVTVYHPGPKSITSHLPNGDQAGLTEVIIPFPVGLKLPGSYIRNSYSFSIAIADNLMEQDHQPDYIYAQGFTAWALLDRKRKGKSIAPIGVNFHGLEMFQQAVGLKQRIIQQFFRAPVTFNLKHADVVYSLGGKLTDILNSLVPAERISVIPIALDEIWYTQLPQRVASEVRKFLFIGRYERRKGIEELNEAIQALHIPNVEFHFVGPIPASKRIQSSQVKYHGKVMEIGALQAIIDDMDVILVPSYSEGLPTVILEGMARGLAVIATDVGAVADLVDSEVGRLIPSGDASALTSALQELSEMPATLLSSMGAIAASRIANSYTWHQVADRTLQDIQDRFMLTT